MTFTIIQPSKSYIDSTIYILLIMHVKAYEHVKDLGSKLSLALDKDRHWHFVGAIIDIGKC